MNITSEETGPLIAAFNQWVNYSVQLTTRNPAPRDIYDQGRAYPLPHLAVTRDFVILPGANRVGPLVRDMTREGQPEIRVPWEWILGVHIY